MRTWDLQTAVYDRLTSASALMALITGIHDHVPQGEEYPYVVIGEDLATNADTDDTLDSDHVVTVHTWSRYRGQKETKEIQQQIYSALHRKPLAVGNAVFVDCVQESQETFLDDDGLTRHGVQAFRVFLDDLER